MRFQVPQQVEQVFAVALVQGRGWLIQNENFDIFTERFGNFYQLLFTHAQ